MKERLPIGCQEKDGEIAMDENKTEIVLFAFSSVEKYAEHPPKELVEAKIEEAAIHGEEISYEDAEKRVSFCSILNYVAKELNQEFEGTISQEQAM